MLTLPAPVRNEAAGRLRRISGESGREPLTADPPPSRVDGDPVPTPGCEVRHAAADRPGRCLRRSPLRRQPGRRLRPRPAPGPGLDAGRRPGDEPGRDRLPRRGRGRLPPPLVHADRRGRPLRPRHARLRPRPLGGRPPPSRGHRPVPHPERPALGRSGRRLDHARLPRRAHRAGRRPRAARRGAGRAGGLGLGEPVRPDRGGRVGLRPPVAPAGYRPDCGPADAGGGGDGPVGRPGVRLRLAVLRPGRRGRRGPRHRLGSLRARSVLGGASSAGPTWSATRLRSGAAWSGSVSTATGSGSAAGRSRSSGASWSTGVDREFRGECAHPRPRVAYNSAIWPMHSRWETGR